MPSEITTGNRRPHPTYDDGRIASQILYETRQSQLDALFSLTGEVMVNEYVPNNTLQENIA